MDVSAVAPQALQWLQEIVVRGPNLGGLLQVAMRLEVLPQACHALVDHYPAQVGVIPDPTPLIQQVHQGALRVL